MTTSCFDAIVLGTGLVESIVAAALSKAGCSVAHVDANPYYGSHDACLDLDELVHWADSPASPSLPFQRISRSQSLPSHRRHYSISLKPAVLPSSGSFIAALVASGVSKYGNFLALDFISVYDHLGHLTSVPASKEDIFKSNHISLIEKRRLMRFLTFALHDFQGKPELEGKQDMPFVHFLKSTFNLPDKIASVLASALAFSSSHSEPTLPVLQRIQKYLRSAGRFGAASPFLVGQHGCIGEIAQGFCRAAAVAGAVYILGREIKSIRLANPQDADTTTFKYAVQVADLPDTLQCNLIISSPPYLPDLLKSEAIQLPSLHDAFTDDHACIARAIVIIDQPLALRSSREIEQHQADHPASEEDQIAPPTSPPVLSVDAGIVIFPPSSVQGGSSTRSATVLINGEGTRSTPKGKWLAYISIALDQIPAETTSPEALLKPYLDTLLSLSTDASQGPIVPLFTTFYIEKVPPPLSLSSTCVPKSSQPYIIPPPLPLAPLPELADMAADIAEQTFMEAMQALHSTKQLNEEEEIMFWPPLPRDEEREEEHVEW